VSEGLIAYEQALAAMAARVGAIAAAKPGARLAAGARSPLHRRHQAPRRRILLDARSRFIGPAAGGQFTYHGPGQRVVYVMLDLKRRGPDVRRYVAALEEWVIHTLSAFGILGERRGDRVGVWVARPELDREDKIAAVGIRLKRWVSLHGIAINIAPDLSHFSGIVPCGISGPRYGVTSLADLGVDATMNEVDEALRSSFEELFGPMVVASFGVAPLERRKISTVGGSLPDVQLLAGHQL